GGDVVRALAGDVDAIEDHPALLRPVDAAQHVEDRSLAGAVRTDDGEQLVPAHGERDAVDRPHALERQPYVLKGDDRIVLGHGPALHALPRAVTTTTASAACSA